MTFKKSTLRSILALILVLAVLVSGCTSDRTPDSSEPDVDSGEAGEVSEAVPVPKEDIASIIESYTNSGTLLAQIADLDEINSDTVGWLIVPNTEINDVVVWNSENNDYYLRRNFEGQDDFNGVFYADYRSAFGDGTAAGLGMNTCIYGHAMTDVHGSQNYGIKMGSLHNFRDKDFAEKTPYLIFATEKEILVWEIFAVFMGNRNDFAYNRNDLERNEFQKIVTEEVLPRSIYDYNVEIGEDDKFLTLSTCIYNLPDGTETGYPDTHYRYGVMARLVGPDEVLKSTADFTENTDMLIDEDNYPN